MHSSLLRRQFAACVIAAGLLLTACPEGSHGEPRSRDDSESWPALKQRAIREIRVAEGWAPVELLPGAVNSTGWEDSVCISNDGQTVWFAYLPCDLMRWFVEGRADLTRFSEYRRGPTRDAVPVFAINVLESRREGVGFGTPHVSKWSKDTKPAWQAESGVAQVGADFVWNTNHPATEDDHDTDIYLNGVRLPAPVNTDHGEDDPYYRKDEILFWSEDRGGERGNKRLWSSRRKDGRWSVPRVMPAPINLPGTDSWQCHLTADGYLYFASNRDGPQTLWVSRRLGADDWEAPTKVAWPSPGGSAIGVNEPTLTEDGAVLGFVVLFQNAAGEYDLDVAWTRRLRSAGN